MKLVIKMDNSVRFLHYLLYILFLFYIIYSKENLINTENINHVGNSYSNIIASTGFPESVGAIYYNDRVNIGPNFEVNIKVTITEEQSYYGNLAFDGFTIILSYYVYIALINYYLLKNLKFKIMSQRKS